MLVLRVVLNLGQSLILLEEEDSLLEAVGVVPSEAEVAEVVSANEYIYKDKSLSCKKFSEIKKLRKKFILLELIFLIIIRQF